MNRLRKRKKIAAALLCLVFAGTMVTGCAHHSETSKREVVDENGKTTTVVTEHEVVKTETHRGVLGSVFHVVGEILAFPFELIADVFRFIF